MLSVAHITAHKKQHNNKRSPQQNKTFRESKSSKPNNTADKSITTIRDATVNIVVPPLSPKEYADRLANAIKNNQINNISPSTETSILLLEKLVRLYKPSLFENQQSSMPIIFQKMPAEMESIQIEPEEFIFLVYQIWYSISESVEQKDIPQNKLLEKPLIPPANTDVIAPQSPTSALKTQRTVSTSTHQNLLKRLSINRYRATTEMHQKHPVVTAESNIRNKEKIT